MAGIFTVTALYLLVNYAWTWPHLALALTSGFLLLAPFLALVFYDLSRQLDRDRLPIMGRIFTLNRRLDEDHAPAGS